MMTETTTTTEGPATFDPYCEDEEISTEDTETYSTMAATFVGHDHRGDQLHRAIAGRRIA